MTHTLVKALKTLSLIAIILLQSFIVNAVTPTPAQLEQFKNLSPEQQKLLAKQFGVDLSSINLPGVKQKLNKAPPVVTPRKVNYPKVKVSQKEDEKPGNSEKQQVKPFGYDLFAGEPTSFTPVTDIPVPAQYIVGPGDEIVIQLYGKENNTLNLVVNRNGKIQFPDLGPISVASLSFNEVRKLLTKRIKNQMIGVESSISLGELRSMRIFVLGEAYKPGSYEVSSLSTITNALFVSGGIKIIGSLRNIQLKRKGKLIERFDLYDLLLNGDTSKDSRLLPGDVVFIPSVTSRVTVRGDVIRPAIYEFKKGETIQNLISMFGGIKSSANTKTVQLDRINTNHVREVLTLDLTTTLDKKTRLKNGDNLIIGSISDFVKETVKVTGAVTRTGLYRWEKGLKVSDIIKNLQTDVLKNADLDYAIVVREINKKHDIKVLQISLSQALENLNDTTNNLTLQSKDELIIFSTNDIYSRKKLLKPILEKLERQRSIATPLQVVTLSGEVRFPGLYPLAEKVNVKNMIKAGGGLKDSAYALSAEITRTFAKPGEVVRIEHVNIDLGNTLKSAAAENIPLQSRDVITIRIKPEWNESARVAIRGEVLFPGIYVIQRGETLNEVLIRAGGVTNLAYLKGAVFMRAELRQKETALLKEMQKKLKAQLAAESIGDKANNLTLSKKDNALTLVDDIESTQAVGRLVIDLPKVLSDPENHDLILKDGDKLVIPPNSQTITVLGQVQHPTSHIYDSKVDYAKYISMSGGITEQADDDRIYVIKANGSVMLPSSNKWFSSNKTNLEAGDTIIVPLDTAYTKPMQLWTSVTQIVYQTAIALTAIGRL